MIEVIEEAVDFVYAQKQSGKKKGVLSLDRAMTIQDNFENLIEQQLFDPRIIEDRNKITQIYFKVSTHLVLRKLVTDQMQRCK